MEPYNPRASIGSEVPFSIFPCGHGVGSIPMQLTQPVVLWTPWETEGSAGKPGHEGLHPLLLCFQGSGNQPNCSLLLIHWTAGPLVQGQSLSPASSPADKLLLRSLCKGLAERAAPRSTVSINAHTQSTFSACGRIWVPSLILKKERSLLRFQR